MAAATVESSRIALAVPFGVYEWQLSSMTDEQLETLTHTFTGVRPVRVDMFVITEPDDHSPLSLKWLQASDSTSANTIAVRVSVEGAGAITGAKVKVWAWFFDVASGGTTPV